MQVNRKLFSDRATLFSLAKEPKPQQFFSLTHGGFLASGNGSARGNSSAGTNEAGLT